MIKLKLFMFSCLFLIAGISNAADIVVANGDTIQNYIDAAVDGDVLILSNGGVYQTNQLVFNKSLTLKAEDGYTTRPLVYCNGTSGILFDNSGVSVSEIGVEFISGGARYLNRINKTDSVHFLKMDDCVVRGFDRNFIQAKDKPSYLDTCIVENCYVYDGGGGSYELIYIDDVTIEELRITNSSFVDFDESFIYCKNVKSIVVENCNIHGRSDRSNQYLFRLRGDTLVSSFTLKNSIISGIKLDKIWDIDDDIVDSIYNVFYHDIEFEDNMTANVWSYEDKFTKTDPMFSNEAAGALYLTEGSPAFTASTSGGFIGASMWTVAPDVQTLINLTINGSGSLIRPAFNNDSLNYTADIPFAYGDTITVEALPVFASAEISGTGKYAWNGSLSLSIDVTVAGNKTFHLDLSRIPPNDDPTLSRIVLQDTTGTYYQMYPADQPGWNVFDLRFPEGMPVLYTIKTDKNFSGTNVSVDDSLDISSGSGELKVYCTAESGKSIIYTINALAEGTGTDASLRAMMLSSSVDTFTTTPPFNPDISNYILEVPAGTDSIFIDAISTDSYASVSYDTLLIMNKEVEVVEVTVTSEDGNKSKTYSVEITVSGTGVNDNLDESFKMLYKPGAEQLAITSANGIKGVQVYSLNGALMINKTNADQGNLVISTSELSKGMYLVLIRSNKNQVFSKKFIK